jgi:SET domain-containing protein 6
LDDELEDALPEELFLLVKTLSMSPDQLKQQISKSKPPKPSCGHTEATILLKAIQMKQDQYATTLAQDKDLLAQLGQSEASAPLGDFARRQKMAIQVRLGEKEVLQTLAGLLENHVAHSGGTTTSKRTAHSESDASRRTKAQRT